MIKKYAVLSIIFLLLAKMNAYGGPLFDAFEGDLREHWNVIAEGPGAAKIVPASSGRRGKILELAMPEGIGKRAVASLRNPLQPGSDSPVRLIFDMRLDTQSGGYHKGIRYGRPGYAVEFGRYGRRNFDKKASHIFLADQHVAVDVRPDAWVRYEVTLGLREQILRAFQYQENGELVRTPIAELRSKQVLSSYENSLLVVNESPFHRDAYGQNRGIVRVDNFRMMGGVLEHATGPESVYTLASGPRRFDIDLSTGQLVAGWLGDAQVISSTSDEYRLVLRNEDHLVRESEDSVVSVITDGKVGVRVVVTNATLPGMKIEKHYHIEQDQLVKTLRLTAEKTLDGFLYVRTACNPSDSLKTGGYYHTIKGWEVDTLRNADTVIMETKIGHPLADTGNQIVALVNKKQNITVGQFQYRVDGKYVWPRHYVHADSTTYSPYGWRFPAIVFHPKAGTSRSIETRLGILHGDQLDFHQAYKKLDEVAQRLAVLSPDWVRKAKFDAVCWGDDPTNFASIVQAALDQSRYAEDEYAFVNMWGWATWGYQPTEPNEKVRIRSETEVSAYKPTQWLVDSIAHIQKTLPGCKFGLYHFPWALAPQSEYGKANKHQMAYNRDGELLPKYEPGWVAAYRALLADDGVSGMLTAFEKEIDRYNVDFFYLDGGVASQSRPDWRTMTADQGYDWMGLWKGVFDVARSAGSDKAVFQNHFVQMFGDAGYYEDGAFAKTYQHNWRVLGDGMLLAKLYQRPGGYLSVLYRGGGGHAEPSYTNMVIATGLRPASAADPHVVPNWPQWFGYLPYVNAAYELRDTVLVDAIMSPRWWADPQRKYDIQAITLRQGAALLLNLVNHSEIAQKATAVIAIENTGLDPNRPLYLWRQALTPATYKEAETAKAPADRKELDRVVTVHPMRIIEVPEDAAFELTEEIAAHTMCSLVVTHEPVVITSVGGRETQFALPDMLDVSARAKIAKNAITVTIDSPDQAASVSVWLPESWQGEKIVDAQGHIVDVEDRNGIQFANISVSRGRHVIQIHYDPIK